MFLKPPLNLWGGNAARQRQQARLWALPSHMLRAVRLFAEIMGPIAIK